jgi:hypothetical protein
MYGEPLERKDLARSVASLGTNFTRGETVGGAPATLRQPRAGRRFAAPSPFFRDRRAMSQTCPSCHQPASGRFCANCGAAVSAECRECGNALPAGARFCNHCGATAGAASEAAPAHAHGASRWPAWLPWSVAGAALVVALAAFLVPRGGDPQPVPAASTAMSGSALNGPAGGTAPPMGAAPAGNAAAVDLSSMTPREAADRLFNRVMQSVSSGDTAQARTFLPMAIGAYGRVGQLDTDGRYHLAVLHLVGGDAQSARTESNAILAAEPRHLFGLFTAAQAETQLGNQARARDLYQRFLSAYETERTRDLPEYRDHQQALGPMRQEAERAVGGS